MVLRGPVWLLHALLSGAAECLSQGMRAVVHCVLVWLVHVPAPVGFLLLHVLLATVPGLHLVTRGRRPANPPTTVAGQHVGRLGCSGTGPGILRTHVVILRLCQDRIRVWFLRERAVMVLRAVLW